MNISGTLFIVLLEALILGSALAYSKFITSSEQRYSKFRSKAIVQGRLGKYTAHGDGAGCTDVATNIEQ